MSLKQLSSCFILTIIATMLSNIRLTYALNTDKNIDKFWKMSSNVEFRLLVLDSLKYSSKPESPINRSAKAVISRSLATVNTFMHNSVPE